MGRLHDLHAEGGQSPWLDNLRRDWLHSGELARWVDRGIRGLTSNPSIFQKAIEGGGPYDDAFAELVRGGADVEAAYWSLVVDDIEGALDVLAPVFDSSGGEDGYVSVEVAPALAHDRDATVAAALELARRIARPNLYVKVPATLAGVEAVRSLVAQGVNVNVTLIFSLERHAAVMEAYLAGLENRVAAGASDLSDASSVASFFISRVDTEIDRRLAELGTDEATELQGRAAVAQGQLAYDQFRRTFAGERWERLAALGARPQRPLWASTSTKNPDYPDTLYVDELIGPDSVNTLPDATAAAFEDHGTVARTVDADVPGAFATWEDVGELVDLADVAEVLEREGVASFEAAFDGLLATLAAKAAALG